MRSLLSNPEALQAMIQIQQGMQRLQTAAPPEVLSSLGFMGLPTMPPSSNSTTPSSTTNTSSAQQTNRPTIPGVQSSNYFAQMLNMMSNNTLVTILEYFLLISNLVFKSK
jgi:ubiquilin